MMTRPLCAKGGLGEIESKNPGICVGKTGTVPGLLPKLGRR